MKFDDVLSELNELFDDISGEELLNEIVSRFENDLDVCEQDFSWDLAKPITLELEHVRDVHILREALRLIREVHLKGLERTKSY